VGHISIAYLISVCKFCLNFLVVNGRCAAITPSDKKSGQAFGLASVVTSGLERDWLLRNQCAMVPYIQCGGRSWCSVVL
jgi:hypothetical protein